jgi:hypothetical protein
MIKTFFRIAFIFLCIAICSSWGFLVHRTVNQLAIYQLPKPMQPFFYINREYLVKNAPRPDLRRNEDSTEATRHFIDLEMFGDSAAWKMPLKWDDVVRKYGKDSLLKYGYVPYYVITMKNRLTNAFRAGNKDSILFYAADLGHYIGDANVPLHSTVNYDGQLSNQKGLHGLWESTIPELEMDQYKLFSKHKANYLSKPEETIWQAVRHAHELVKDVFAQETEASKNFTDAEKFKVQTRNGREVKSYSTAFAKAYSARLGKTVNEQLLKSAELIADFWYTAWVDAGKPDLSKLLSKPFDKKDRREMKKEFKAYWKGELLEKKLLIAKQISGNSGQ